MLVRLHGYALGRRINHPAPVDFFCHVAFQRHANISPATLNFAFLHDHDPVLVSLAARAEAYVFDDPNTAIVKTRQLAETLVKGVAAKIGLLTPDDHQSFADLQSALRQRELVDRNLDQIIRMVRTSGNTAVHELAGDRRLALHSLKQVRHIAIWFHRTVTGNTSFRPGPFHPPAEPENADEELRKQLQVLAKELEAAQSETTELKNIVAEQRVAYRIATANEQAALELAEETEESFQQQIAAYEALLSEQSVVQASRPSAETEEIAQTAHKASHNLDLDEADTRKLIDQQLRDAGWTVDSEEIRYSKGKRPQKNRNLAIAEWPTASGPADYVLFVGLTPVATVEAKRKRRNARTALDQAERYSRDFQPNPEVLMTESPWGKFQIPFAFSTNGHPFHRQVIAESGIWFRDLRQTTNHPKALTGWYTPEGLSDLLTQDIPAANKKLQLESPDYLPLRYYQQNAISAVEQAITNGQTEILLAMATGTGKTRTAICLLYRLIKAGRFNRVLFVVDRRSLGEQARDSFGDVKLENNQTFPDIYDVKELGDLRPERDTRLHICTIQSMVKRVVDHDVDDVPFPIDQYDCLIIDECHRGYILDREMSEQELSYRSEADYVSKYRRVLDHFDAVRIGLTATPALHTTEIFGEPVFEYSYRQAVIDRNLADYEPPFIIRTELSEQGIHWDSGEDVQHYDTFTKSVATFTTPDEIDIEVDGFNKVAVTENFNRVVCEVLAKQIDPHLPGKTLIFCVRDKHADTVVEQLTEALEAEHGPVPHDTVKKITGELDNSSEAIRRFKNEEIPKFAVTVDLLTTGIDVPSITNIVFLRRTKSRILFDQMIGRATRLCDDLHGPGQDKDYFHIYDAVGVYQALQRHTDMKPVVASPQTSFRQLVEFLQNESDEVILQDVREQLVSKLRRKSRSIENKWAATFDQIAGDTPEGIANLLQTAPINEVRQWFTDRPTMTSQLDQVRAGSKVLISEHEDSLVSVDRGYGDGTEPEDYLGSFRSFLVTHSEDLPVLTMVTQRPSELTRKHLIELRSQLDANGFSEASIKSAVRDTTNIDIAASIIGFVRNAMLDEPLVPYEERVDKAIRSILSSQQWASGQRQWLQRIGRQMKENVVMDRDAFDSGAFKQQGGFARLNKVFDGKLEELVRQISETVWQVG